MSSEAKCRPFEMAKNLLSFCCGQKQSYSDQQEAVNPMDTFDTHQGVNLFKKGYSC